MLLFLSCSTSFASEIDFAPKWSNIAPAEYSKDIQYIENNTFDKKHPYWSVATAMTLVGVPVVVTLNAFATDTKNELAFVQKFCEDRDCEFAGDFEFAKGNGAFHHRYSW